MASLESLNRELDKLRVEHGVCKWLAVATIFLFTLQSVQLHSFLMLVIGLVLAGGLASNAYASHKRMIKLQKRIGIVQINIAVEKARE